MAEIIGNNIIRLSSVDSTNNYATKRLSKSGWNEGTVIFADEQYLGRGQLNNIWESEPKKNIIISIVLYPDFLPVQFQFLLSKVIALGVSDLISLYVDDVSVKWPNDIYVGEKKIAGILIENSIMGSTLNSSIAGIGLNVNQSIFESEAPNPVSLFRLVGRVLDRNQILIDLLGNIDKWYAALVKRDIGLINRTYLKMLYRVGIVAEYKDVSGVYKGTIVGVNKIGQLEIKPEKGDLRTYHFKEVVFL